MIGLRMRARWAFRDALLRAAQHQAPLSAATSDVVVLPCWRRPEFLWHCLDNLTNTEEFGELHVLFRPDTGYSPEILEVIHEYAPRLPSFEVQFPDRCPYRRTKQSANVLLGYLQAAVLSRRYVFLVEEDVMVARDFFRWHRAVHAAAGELFCSIAVRNPNGAHPPCDNPEEYYLNTGDYCSYGVCFDRHVLRQLVAPHVNLAYMRRPKKYLRRQFPTSRVGLGFVEQDGLLRRIQEAGSLPIAYPCLPRAFDAGFYGYNRPGGLPGSLAERVGALGRIIYSPEAMRQAALRPEFAGVSTPINLRPPPWRAQHRAVLVRST